MNQRLIEDLEDAFCKLKELNQISERINKLNGRIKYLNFTYDKLRDAKDRRMIYVGISFAVNFAILICYANCSETLKHKNIVLFATAAAFIVSIFCILKHHKIRKERNKRKADSWWETNAAEEAVNISSEINDLRNYIARSIQNNYVLRAIPSNELSLDTISELHTIVECGRADTINAAISIWIDRECSRLEHDREVYQREQQLSALNDRLSDINQKLEEREFYEDIILMDLASRD